MDNQVVYFENLSVRHLLIWLVSNSNGSFNKLFSLSKVYYFDLTFFSNKVIIPLLRRSNVRVEKLNFKMMDIKDDKGELVRLRISRLDLFDIKNKIVNSEKFISLLNETFQQGRLLKYITKGLVDGGITNEKSLSRVLFIISVVDWHMQKYKYDHSTFLINNRPWLDIIREYAKAYKIRLYPIKAFNLFISKEKLQIIVRNFPRFYGMLMNIREKKSFSIINKHSLLKNMAYIDGRGDINLHNDGYHTDFFFNLNSDFPKGNILYKHISYKEKEYLKKNGIFSVPEGFSPTNIYSRNYIKPRITYDNRFKDEITELKYIISSYDIERLHWSSFFKKYGVKIYFTWYKYTNSHIAASDAINDNGGISVLWQMAYEGFPIINCQSNFDISFCFSKYSYEIDKQVESRIRYTVITGYTKDYAPALLKEPAAKIREKLQKNGAKKIIFAIDETSTDDSRWHTGHELQRENYLYILEKVIENPWLGVVFKPKVASTLRQRLGPVADLLSKVEKTGRCFIYETAGRRHTSAPPILAGLSADICIHGHLSSGTAALECALEGLPTLLIDREGALFSKLNELPVGKVVFNDWASAINAVMEHFSSPNGISGFGDWSSIIEEIDPFRDGKAAYRIGSYLHWLIQGYDQGLDKETIMLNAAEKYKKQWGEDKIICA